MKILVLGQGGREHALVRAFAQSPTVAEIHAIPGNDGMRSQAMCHAIDWKDSEAIIQFCLCTEIDFVMIGPEDPLVAGLAEQLRDRGILCVGPNQEAARLEGSKIFSKEFMLEAGVPTAKSEIVDSVEGTLKAAAHFTPPYVLKADGLCAGKGVVIAKTLDDLKKAAEDFFVHQTLGAAGTRALLEQFTPGWELSYLVLTNGHDFQALPLAQDHKRLLDNGEGPNTGGMGTVAPLGITDELRKRIDDEVVKPSIALIQSRALIYRGVLFIGLMITDQGPSVLEYNVRFGDPETQVILPLIDGDVAQLLLHLAKGQLHAVRTRRLASCCVIQAAPGYPESPVKGVAIEGDLAAESASAYFIHAGTKKEGATWVTNGGRVLGAVGLGSTLQEAIETAYAQASKARWKDMRMRSDIGRSLTSSSADRPR